MPSVLGRLDAAVLDGQFGEEEGEGVGRYYYSVFRDRPAWSPRYPVLPLWNVRRGRSYHVKVWEIKEMLKRASVRPTNIHPPDEWVTEASLWDFLSQQEWEDGKARETGTILLFVDGGDGNLKAMIRDRDQGLIAFATYTGEGAVAAWLNHVIEGEHTDWRKEDSKKRK
jgi:hypothetical protein